MTVRQAVICHCGPVAPTTLLRELVRFGVTELFLVGDRSPLPVLPRDVQVTAVPSAPDRGRLDERFLLCDATADLDFNLARLLGRAGPCIAMRDGVDTGVRVVAAGYDGPTVDVPSLPIRPPRPALMLDRDGTINVDHGYVGTRDRFEWIDGALAAIRMATEAGWHVFVVTNQSGIARGLYDEAALGALHDWMVDEIRRAGGNVDDLRTCPFHEDALVPAYRKASDWRKPAPGMILDLITRWSLDPARCVLVGDQPTDLQAAQAAGIAGCLFSGGNLAEVVIGFTVSSPHPACVSAPSLRAEGEAT